MSIRAEDGTYLALFYEVTTMLIGESWVLDHLRTTKGSGNTATGRAWMLRVKTENPSVTVRCDGCGTVEMVTAANMIRLRHVVKRSTRQESKFGQHLCEPCLRPLTQQKAKATKSSPAWRAGQVSSPSWQSQASPERMAVITENMRKSQRARFAKATPRERSKGVIRQWQVMTDEDKETRANKIRKRIRQVWAALTPEQRNARVKKMIKGLPRSATSDAFREALKQAGLYEGFQSEMPISGFIADECHPELKLVIEFYGDYYHCNPQRYTADWYNTTTHMTAAQRWQYDRRRLAAFRKYGYRTLVVWESEWLADPKRVVEAVRAFRTGSSPQDREL